MNDPKELSNELLDLTSELVQMVDASGRFVFVNGAWCRTLGWTREEASELHFTDILDPILVPHCLSMFQEIGKGASFKGIEVRFRTKQGGTVLLNGSVSGRFQNGAFTHTNGFFTDVTAQRKQEDLLSSQSALLRNLAGGMPLTDALVSLALLLSRSTDAFQAWYWVASGSQHTKPVVVAPKFAGEFSTQLQISALFPNDLKDYRTDDAIPSAALPSPGCIVLETLRSELGMKSSFCIPLRGRNGSLLAVLGLMGDLSREDLKIHSSVIEFMAQTATLAIERWRDDREARSREALKISIFEHALDSLITVDTSGRVLEWNPAAERMFGCSRAEAAGRRISEFVTPPNSENGSPNRSLMIGFQGRMPERTKLLEQLGRRSDGEFFPIELSITPTSTSPPLFTCFIRDISTRRMAEERLRRSEKRFQQLFASNPLAMVHSQGRGRIIDVNRQFSDLFGTPRAHAVGRNCLEDVFWLIPGDRKRLFDLFRRQDHVDGFETRLQNLKGREFDALISAQRLMLEDQFSIVASIMDISDRRQAARESLEKDRLLRLVIDLVPHFIFAQDAQSRFIFVNRSMAEACGVAPEQMVGRQRDDFPSHLLLTEHLNQPGARGRELNTLRRVVEHRFKDCQGESRRLQTQAIPFEVPSTGERALLGVSIDVTQIVEAEETARASEARKTAVLESSLDGIVTIESSGVIVEWNRAAERIFGFTSSQAIGKRLDTLIVPERFRTAHRSGLNQLLTSGKSSVMRRLTEMPAIRSDGTEFPTELYIVPTRTSPPLFTGFIRDISERKRIEQAQSKLETHVRQVQKLEAMGTLAGGIAHDFNNILAAILSNSELGLLEVGENPTCRQCLSEIQTAALRAKGLTQQILTFSRVQRSSEVQGAVDAGPVISEAIRMLRATIPSGIKLISRIDACSYPVKIDPTHLHQLVINLGTNAWHAVEANQGHIMVGLGSERVGPTERNLPMLKPGKYLSLVVADTGLGMDKATQERIFEPFFTTKATGKGTGLGLSVVQGIVRQAGGAAFVESTPGQGASFEILLPLASEGLTLTESPSDEKPVRKGSLLVIDDEESLLKVTCKLLDRIGHHVQGYTDAAAALAQFSLDPGQWDLVITDQNMPTTSGLSISEKLLRIRPGLPIILVTGELTEGIQENARRVGISELIQKPINISALAQKIQELLDRRATGKVESALSETVSFATRELEKQPY